MRTLLDMVKEYQALLERKDELAVISLVTMTKAIHYIGSTPTAILGALAPVTALFFGVLIFGEQLTPRIIPVSYTHLDVYKRQIPQYLSY